MMSEASSEARKVIAAACSSRVPYRLSSDESTPGPRSAGTTPVLEHPAARARAQSGVQGRSFGRAPSRRPGCRAGAAWRYGGCFERAARHHRGAREDEPGPSKARAERKAQVQVGDDDMVARFASPRITACRRRVWHRGGVALQLPGDTARRRSYRYGRLTSAPVRRCCLCCYSASLLNTARSNMVSYRQRTILSRNVFRHSAAAICIR